MVSFIKVNDADIALYHFWYAQELKWLSHLEKRCQKIFGETESLTKEEFHQVIQYEVQFLMTSFMAV